MQTGGSEFVGLTHPHTHRPALPSHGDENDSDDSHTAPPKTMSKRGRAGGVARCGGSCLLAATALLLLLTLLRRDNDGLASGCDGAGAARATLAGIHVLATEQSVNLCETIAKTAR